MLFLLTFTSSSYFSGQNLNLFLTGKSIDKFLQSYYLLHLLMSLHCGQQRIMKCRQQIVWHLTLSRQQDHLCILETEVGVIWN